MLVGGLVPPLLRRELDPEDVYTPPGSPRRTSEQDGVNDAHSRDLSEEIAVGHRNALAGAVQQVLKVYRSG